MLQKSFNKVSDLLKQKPFRNGGVIVLLFALILQVFYVDPTNVLSLNASLKATASVYSDEKTSDLVLILVDAEMFEDNQDYSNQYTQSYSEVGNSNIRSRVERYARDIQVNYKNYYQTDDLEVTIIPTQKLQSPESISTLLKQAYFQNLNQLQETNLKGVVLMGGVPLPIVNKNGNLFPSVYPYTDFENPTFSYDSSSGYFLPNQVQDPIPEIWHGLINLEDPSQLAEYLDKNHLYYSGVPDFADFEENIFFSEPIHDASSFNQDLYASYLTYSNFIEEFTYNRFSQNLLEFLNQNSAGFVADAIEASLSTNSDSLNVPDIFIKPSIESFVTPITEVFTVALREQRANLLSTGRYQDSEFTSGLIGIAKLDELSALYLKEVNQLVEDEIDSIMGDIQQNITLVEGAKLTPILKYTNDDGDTIEEPQEPIYFVNHSRQEDLFQLYINVIPGLTQSTAGLATDEIIDLIFSENGPLSEEDLITNAALKINGTRFTDINTPAQCRVFRGGGTANPLDKTVRTHRGIVLDRDPQVTPQRQVCYKPYDKDDPETTWTKIENTPGIFGIRDNLYNCTTFAGEDLQDNYRMDEVELDFQSPLTAQSCYGMRTTGDYLDMLKTQYSSVSSSQELQSAIDKLNSIPDYQNLSLANFNGSNITLGQFLSVLPEYRSLKLNPSAQFDWHAFSAQILGNPTKSTFSINLNSAQNSNLQGLTIEVDQYGTPKQIPSLIKHADPTPGVISNAYDSINPDLPINATRYVTFTDKNGNSQELIYPNLFKSDSFQSFQQKLAQLESTLTSLSKSNQNYSGRLTSLISSTQDQYENQVLTAANPTKVEFFTNWQDFDLNQKYKSSHELLLSSNPPFLLNNLPQNYEITHLTGTTKNENLDFNILDFQDFDIIIPEESSLAGQYEEQVDQENIIAQQLDPEESINLFTYFTDYLPSWFEEQKTRVSRIVSPEKPEPQNIDALFGSTEVEPELVQVESNSFLNITGKLMELKFTLVDESGVKSLRNQTQTITTNLPSNINSQIDQDPDTDGIQINFISGISSVSFQAPAKASYQISFPTNTYEFKTYTNPSLQISSSTQTVQASPTEKLDLTITLRDEGELIPFPKPSLQFTTNLSNPRLEYTGQNPQLSSEHTYDLYPGTKTGQIALSSVLSPGSEIKNENYIIDIISGPAQRISFTNSYTKVSSNEPSEVSAVLVDEFQNPVLENSSNYTVSYDYPDKLSQSPSSIQFNQGKANLQFQSASSAFGNVYFEVKSADNNISGVHKLVLSSELDLGELGSDLNSLILNLFTDQSSLDKDYVVNSLINSKVQSISTHSTDLLDKQPLLYVHPTGGVLVPQNSPVQNLTTYTNSQFQTIFTDSQSNQMVELSLDISGKPLVSIAQATTLDELTIEIVNPDIQVDQNAVRLGSENLILLNPDQSLKSFSDQIEFTIANSNRYSVSLTYQGQVQAIITFNPTSQNQVSIKPNSRNSNLEFRRQSTLSSTSQPLGYKFYNPKVDLSADQLPQSINFRSEDSLTNPHVGLVQGSKVLHLLASSTPVGEANRPSLSEAGIVIGDPMITLDQDLNTSTSNMSFNQTLGRFINRKTDSQLVDIVQIPSLDKTAVAYQDGTVGLLDNTTLQYIPNFLLVPNGIKTIQVAKFNKDEETLVFQTDQACSEGDSCLYVFNSFEQDQKVGVTQLISPNLNSQDGYELDRNKLSTLNRLDLNLDSKISQVIFHDMNNDNFDDLVAVTEDEILNLFWNVDGQIQSNPNQLGHTRTSFQTDDLLLEKTLIANFPGAPNSTAKLGISTQATEVTETFQTPSGPIQSQQVNTAQTISLSSITSIPELEGSTARVIDLDGNTLENNDILEYTVTLNNNSSQSYQGLTLSLPIPENQILSVSSLQPSTARFLQTTDSLNRRYLVDNINLAANSATQIKFNVRYERPNDTSPPIVSINQSDQEDILPVQDGYPDLKILLPDTNYVTYFYSNYDRGNNVLAFRRFDKEQESQAVNPNESILESFLNLPDNPSTDQQESIANSLKDQAVSKDSDNDGIIDIYDGVGSLDKAGVGVQNAIQKLTCGGGGCLAVPKNEGFLVPGDIPGSELPVFAWGCPPAPTGGFSPFWPPQPYQSCSGGRIYVSPTLTGELAGSVCIGPHRQGMCYTFSITDLGDLCAKINKSLQDIITKASDFAESASGGAITVGSSSGQNKASNIQIPGFPEVLTNWITNQWKEINRKIIDLPDINVIYPDPQSLVGYVTPIQQNQKQNFVYNDPYPQCTGADIFSSTPSLCGNLSSYQDVLVAKQNAKSRSEFNSADDLQSILEDIALMPLFDINYQKVYISYPDISEKEFSKYKTELSSLRDQVKLEFFTKGMQWGCFANTDIDSITKMQTELDQGTFLQSLVSASNQGGNVQAACLRVAAGIEGIDLNIKENLLRIEEYRELPKNIVRIENFVANYADQILQYAETVLSTTLGWLTENTSTLVQWEQSIVEVERLVDELEIVLDFSTDFMESCDDCRSNRTEDGINSLISFFASLSPDLPVIEIPSWPDITLDVSDIQAGVDITLPEFELKKDPITLPDLNLQFVLPSTPDATLGIPGSGIGSNGFNLELYLQAFEVPLLPEPPNLDELELFDDLPELPELEIPQLPSLPKPPSIKSFTGNFTKKIEPTIKLLTKLVRIYCLISKGLVPLPESKIKDQIETMTNRPLAPVLPVDISFQVPASELDYNYLDEIVFKLTTQLDLEFDEIQTNSQEIADYLNSFSSNITDSVEQGLQENFNFLNAGEVNLLGDDLTNQIESTDLENLTSFAEALGDMQKEINSFNESIPDQINLKATSKPYIPSQSSQITWEEYRSHPMLIAKSSQQKVVSKFASIQSPKLEANKKVINTEMVNTNIIAQSNSISQTLTTPTYNPEDGIYTIDQLGNAQKLLAYNSNLQGDSQVEIADLDKDGDDDIIYSLENTLYLKINDYVNTISSYGTESPRILQFDDLLDDFNTESTETPTINFDFSHNHVQFDLPINLENQDLVLDVYKITLEGTESYQRYHIQTENSQVEIRDESFDRVISIPSQPNLSLPLSNGNYLARLSVVTSESLHIIQSNIPLTPNTCGDNIPPNIILNSDQEVDVPLFSSYTVDLSESYDSQSSISQIYIDNNLQVDSDQDGNKTNDKNLQGEDNLATSIFQLGPFNQIQTRRYQIFAEDINGNIQSQLLTLNVIPPDITITEGQGRQIDGQLNPVSANTPITMVRQRNGVLSPIAELQSDTNGQFTFTPENNSTSIVIKDINQRDIFRVNKSTGTIQLLDPSANLEFNPYSENQNTSVSLRYNNQILTRVQKVADSAYTPIISTQNLNLNQLEDIGVYIQDTNPQAWLASLVDNQVVISNSSNPALTITSSGQFTLLDASLEVQVSEVSSINDLQTFDIYANSIKQFSVFVNVPNELQVQDPTDIEVSKTRTVTFTPPLPEFEDISSSDESASAIERLQELGIIEGVRRGNQVFFEPEREITRAEFSKVILEALCLAPTPQSKLPPQAFSDIPYNQNDPLWYYDYTKETQLLGLFNGYLAEQDPQTGLFPFKPGNDITLAEASKVILEALEYKSVIQFDLPSEFDGPWYNPYLEIASDLTPYITAQAARTNSLLNNQLLTSTEIQNPNKTITREEFAVIASRVLDLYNCFEVEDQSSTQTDSNGQPSSPDGSNDNSSQPSANEDITLVFPNPGRPGLYIDQIACNSCPCAYTINDENDIIKGDIIFAVLLGPNQEIYSQSNTLTIRQ